MSNGDHRTTIVIAPPVRATQSFVGTMAACWKRPSLTGLEILWRWLWGIPSCLLLWHEGLRIAHTTPLNDEALKQMTLLDPIKTAQTLGTATALLLPPVLETAKWLAPLLIVSWIIVSSLGRTLVLRRADPDLSARPFTTMVLQAVRLAALFTSFAIWYRCLQWAAHVSFLDPMAHHQEPSVVLYFAIAIVATLGMFTLWGIVSWVFSMAPLLSMLRNLGVRASLAASFRLGSLKMKLVEINLVMGIVKIALIVLAMVFSACPLPFETYASRAFLMWWWIVGSILYFVASDYFHIVRLAAYLELWRSTGHEAVGA